MSRKTIGVLALIDEQRESYWMLPGYLDGVLDAGGMPLMLPPTLDEDAIAQMAEGCDGFLFTGGHDVDPGLYGEERIGQCGIPSHVRDSMETVLFRMALELGKPVFGICRGMQFINAVLGGTLFQDLPAQRPSAISHRQEPPYDRPAHAVHLEEGSPLRGLMGRDEIMVNSYHHQGIRDLAPGLEVMARAGDGLPEAVCMAAHRFVWAVQWHPEFAHRSDPDCARLFSAFVRSCG